jgi:hypothetical protein
MVLFPTTAKYCSLHQGVKTNYIMKLSGGGKGNDNLQNDEGEDEDETGKENKAIKKIRAI